MSLALATIKWTVLRHTCGILVQMKLHISLFRVPTAVRSVELFTRAPACTLMVALATLAWTTAHSSGDRLVCRPGHWIRRLRRLRFCKFMLFPMYSNNRRKNGVGAAPTNKWKAVAALGLLLRCVVRIGRMRYGSTSSMC